VSGVREIQRDRAETGERHNNNNDSNNNQLAAALRCT